MFASFCGNYFRQESLLSSNYHCFLPTEPEIKLLSQKEIENLRYPESFNANYKYFLKHQIKNKVHALSDELVLLSDAGFLNSLSDFNKTQEASNKLKSSLVNEKEAGPMGFEPMTFSLEG